MAKRKRKYSSKPKNTAGIKAQAVIEEPKDEEEVETEEVETPVEEISSDEPEISEEEPTEDEVKVVSRPKKIIRRTSKTDKPQVSYRKVVYVGTADISTVRGAVTGNKYSFTKDKYGMPKATNVDERDYSGIIALKGKGCTRRDPQALFLTEQDWDLEIAEAKRVNS